MEIERRAFLAGSAALAATGPVAPAGGGGKTMYGLIGRMTAQPGQRAALAAILVDVATKMPGCLSYIVANDPDNADTLWITEAWVSQEAHAGSLSQEEVKAAIAKGRPLIAGMERVAETEPVGGAGLAATR